MSACTNSMSVLPARPALRATNLNRINHHGPSAKIRTRVTQGVLIWRPTWRWPSTAPAQLHPISTWAADQKWCQPCALQATPRSGSGDPQSQSCRREGEGGSALPWPRCQSRRTWSLAFSRCLDASSPENRHGVMLPEKCGGETQCSLLPHSVHTLWPLYSSARSEIFESQGMKLGTKPEARHRLLPQKIPLWNICVKWTNQISVNCNRPNRAWRKEWQKIHGAYSGTLSLLRVFWRVEWKIFLFACSGTLNLLDRWASWWVEWKRSLLASNQGSPEEKTFHPGRLKADFLDHFSQEFHLVVLSWVHLMVLPIKGLGCW